MTITERLMQPGSWDLALVDSTPPEVRDAIDYFGQVLVLPGHVDSRLLGAGQLAPLARYSGAVHRRTRQIPFNIGGGGPLDWLSDEQGKGFATYTGTSAGAAQGSHSAADWIDRVCGVADGTLVALTPGAVYASAVAAVDATFSLRPRREALDYLASAFASQYRVNPILTLDFGPAGLLFHTSPVAVALPGGGGRDLGLRGLATTDLSVAEDVEDYATTVEVYTEAADRSRATTGGASITGAWLNPRAHTVVLDKFITAPNSVGGSTSDADFAAAELAKISAARPQIRLSVNGYDVGSDVQPGDNLYVYDPIAGLADPAQAVRYRGMVIYPAVVRVFAVTWPVQQGMGVYHVAGSGVVTDLTEWVAWESGDTQLEVGAPSRLLA